MNYHLRQVGLETVYSGPVTLLLSQISTYLGVVHDGTYVSNCSMGRGSGISYSPESSRGTASRRSLSFPVSAITRPATAFWISGLIGGS